MRSAAEWLAVDSRARIVVVGGPTGAGKTTAAVAVAKAYDAVVFSADAMQVYRGMDIGTGKASVEERGGVPHFGIDVVDPDHDFDAAAFVALADEVIAAHPRVLVAGGTSLYLQSLIRGLVVTPPVDPALRAALEASDDLFDQLMAVDRDLAHRLHPNDRLRLVRGLEVYWSSGQRLSALQAEHRKQPDRVVASGVWLDRSDLDSRIDARVLEMVDHGYVAEVRRLLDAGYATELKPMQSLGYRHFAEHLRGGLSLEEAVQRTQRDTRRFARKQRTWNRTLKLPVALEDHEQRVSACAEKAWLQA